MIATATGKQYRQAIAALAAWDGIDALVVIFVRPLLIRAEDVAEAVRARFEDMPRPIPVQAVFMSSQDRAAMIRKGGVDLSVSGGLRPRAGAGGGRAGRARLPPRRPPKRRRPGRAAGRGHRCGDSCRRRR